MKRNLSSQAIKAMAIGMALTMATSTAISGTVVNAYAMDTVELAANDHNNNVTVTSANKQNEEKVTITLTATGGTFSTTTAGAGFLQEDGLKGFIVKKDNTEITSNDSLTATLTDSGTITIDVPTAELTGAKSVTVSYVAPKDTGNKIQFTASGGGLSEEEAETLAEPQDLALENVAVPTDSIDITAPTLEVKANAYNATNNTITLTTKDSEELKEMSANNTGGFTITAAGKADTYEITKVEVPTNAKSTVVLTVGKKAGGAGISEQSEPVLTNGTYNITYNATTAATNAIKDAKGNPLADISETPLKLTVGEGTPTPSGKVELEKAAIDSTKKVITLTAKSSETDLGNNTISQNAKDAGFTIKKGNQAITGNDIKTITVNEGTKELGTAKVNTIKLELTNALADGDYTVEYKTPSSVVIENLKDTTTGLAFTVGNPAEKEDFTFKGTNGTYTFEKVAGGVTLVGFEKATETKAESNGNTFNKGIFKTSKGEYKLVQIGKAAANAETFGTTPDLKTITDTDLAGHLDYVNTIKASAFAGNTGITNITFPAVTNVEASAFSGATNLVTVNLPKVLTVGKEAFKDVKTLTTVDLGSQVESGKTTTIASDTFGGNTALETIVTNPQSQQNITDNTTNTGGNPSIIVLDENQYNEIGAKIEENKYYKTKDGLTFVGLNSTDLAFIGKSSPFTPPSIPHSLDGTFGKEYYVTYDQATGTVKLVGSDNPEKPPVNKNLTVKVGTNILTFTSNDGKTATLTGITAESSAVTAEETAGNTLKDGILTVNGDTYTFNAIGNGNAPVVTGNTIDVVTVLANNLNNVTTINSKAFENYGVAPVRESASNLNITFPAVTTVGASAFKGATAFTQVHLPKVTEIQDNAFNGATSLTNITIPNVKTIGTSAFQGASALKEVILPNVESIGSNAFASAGTSASSNPFKIFLGDKATNIGNGAFLGAGGSGAGKLEISTNNQAVIDAVNGSNSNLPADTIKNAAPFILSATVTNPTTITLKLSEKVYTEETTAETIKGWFTVNKTVEAPQALASEGIKSVTVATSKDKASDTIVITLEDTNKIDWTHTVTVAYNNNGKPIKDTAESAANFELEGAINVTNNIQAPAPVQIDVNDIRTRVEANQVKLLIPNKYGIQNTAQDITGDAGFKLTKAKDSDGTYTDETIEITKVSVKPDSASQSPNTTNVILTVNSISASDSNLKLEYKGGNQVVAKEGDVIKPIAPIGSTIIANTLDTNPPTLTGAKYTKGSGKITITGSEYLLPVNNVAAINSLFKVEVTTAGKAQATTLPVTNVTVGANSKDIVLTINDANLPNAATGLKVTYTQAANENLDTPQIRDTNYNTLKTATQNANIDSPSRSVSTFANTTTGNTEGDVTTIRKPNNLETNVTLDIKDIQQMLTEKLTTIENGTLVNNTNETIILDFSRVNISEDFNISQFAFGGTSKIDIKGLDNNEKLILARKIEGASNVTIDRKTPTEVIDQLDPRPERPTYPDNNYGGGSSGSSSGSSNGGAVIGTVTNDNNQNNNNNNNNNQNNNNNNIVDKTLSLDIINLPSINGEPKVFGDVPASYWAKPYIDKLSTAGIINGANGNFMPNGQTKRADVTIMLVNLLGLTPEANSKFTDVNPSAYYAPFVGTASTYGIVNGSNGMFNPENVISRQDTMVMIAQILKGLNLNVNNDASALTKFSDVSKISPYANESVAILVNSGIISGNNGKLNPTSPVTRAEMATIMSKLYDVLAAAK